MQHSYSLDGTQTKGAASPHGIGGLKNMKFTYRTIASREALAGVIASSLRCGAAAATSTEGAAEHQMQAAQAEHTIEVVLHWHRMRMCKQASPLSVANCRSTQTHMSASLVSCNQHAGNRAAGSRPLHACGGGEDVRARRRCRGAKTPHALWWSGRRSRAR